MFYIYIYIYIHARAQVVEPFNAEQPGLNLSNVTPKPNGFVLQAKPWVNSYSFFFW